MGRIGPCRNDCVLLAHLALYAVAWRAHSRVRFTQNCGSFWPPSSSIHGIVKVEWSRRPAKPGSGGACLGLHPIVTPQHSSTSLHPVSYRNQ